MANYCSTLIESPHSQTYLVDLTAYYQKIGIIKQCAVILENTRSVEKITEHARWFIRDDNGQLSEDCFSPIISTPQTWFSAIFYYSQNWSQCCHFDTIDDIYKKLSKTLQDIPKELFEVKPSLRKMCE